jgi:serine/threonine-protein kinase
VFQDGLGERRHTSGAANQPLEVLVIHEELTTVPAFEASLRERIEQFAAFQHPSFTRVRGAGRLTKGQARLVVASDRVPGVRLSEILTAAEQRLIPLEIDAAICLLRQIVPAIAALHATAPDACHGALGPERIILTADANAVVVEHVFGSALEQLRISHERYWSELRIPLPMAGGLPRFDRRADVTQIGALALALILGRQLGDDEYPARVADIVEGVRAISATGLEPLPSRIRSWLSCALQLDPRRSFATAIEAQAELDALSLGSPTRLREALESFLAQYHAAVEREPSADPLPAPVIVSTAAAEPLREEEIEEEDDEEDDVERPVALPLHRDEHVAAPIVAEPRQESEPEPAVRRSVRFPWRPEPPLATSQQANTEHAQPTAEPRQWRGRLIAAAVVIIAVATGVTLAARHVMKAPSVGTLAVNTNRAGAQVMVDGEPKGVTPLTIELSSGPHVVVVSADGQARTIPVTISTGAQVAQFIELPSAPVAAAEPPPIAPPAPVAAESAPQVVAGWIAIAAPIDVQVHENGRLLGTSQSERIMLSVGRHELELSNSTVGYRASRVVQVAPGKVSSIAIQLPMGTLALNATPWAEVWVDGEKIGETPIGSVPVSVGTHDVVFRHPELGEQRHAVTVTLAGPARVSADLRKR